MFKHGMVYLILAIERHNIQGPDKELQNVTFINNKVVSFRSRVIKNTDFYL